MPKYLEEIETELLPLFEGLQYPEQIEFEDDILLTLTAFMRMKRGITRSCEVLLPHFGKVFSKQNGMLGHMF
jgi:hypothetical protein